MAHLKGALISEELMRRLAAISPIVLALGAIIVVPMAGAQAQSGREEGPREIEKCQTIDKPGSYKLVNNLTGPFTSLGGCLVITTDFVTIDLAGFTISGSGHGTGPGIQALPSPGQGQRLQGLAVKNGSISDFFFGVEFSLADGSIVQGLRVVGSAPNTDGIVANGIVKGNTVMSYETGFVATGTVTGNYGALNSDVGFVIGTGSTVIGNTATGARAGLSVSCPSNMTDNTAVNNTVSNLVLLGSGCNNTNNVAP
jgi:hypothetical protein